MVDIAPFTGFRPPKDLVEKLASVPYDVIDSDEARQMAAGNAYSFLHVVKPEIDLDPEIDLYDDKVYAQGAENLRKFVAAKWLVRDATPCFYLYAQRMGNHRQIGLVAGASVLEYQQDIIKKHEHTRADKEADRTRHVATLNANTGPVFLTYRQQPEIDQIVEQICAQPPQYDFTTADAVQHTFWMASAPETIASLRTAFTKVPLLYVADGHHRSASAVRVGEMRKLSNPLHVGDEAYNYFLSVIFPHNQMQIMAYNRVITDLGGMNAATILARIEEKFVVAASTTPLPSCRHEFTMYLADCWYKLQARPEILNAADVVASLDASILQKHVLAPLFGITNPRTDNRIRFVGGIKGSEALVQGVKKAGQGLAFALYPVAIEDLMAVANAGEVMPPKSTWFEPKLRSGLVVKPLL